MTDGRQNGKQTETGISDRLLVRVACLLALPLLLAYVLGETTARYWSVDCCWDDWLIGAADSAFDTTLAGVPLI